MSSNPSKKYFLRKKRESRTEDFKILYNLTFSNRISSFKRNKINSRKDFKEDENKKISSEKSQNINFEKKSISNSNKTNYSINNNDNSEYNFSEREEEKIYFKVKIPLFKEFINEKNEIIKFKCYPDYHFNCEKISEKIQKNIYCDFDNDEESDNGQIKHEKKKVMNFLKDTFELIKNSENYLQQNLTRKMVFGKM